MIPSTDAVWRYLEENMLDHRNVEPSISKHHQSERTTSFGWKLLAEGELSTEWDSDSNIHRKLSDTTNERL